MIAIAAKDLGAVRRFGAIARAAGDQAAATMGRRVSKALRIAGSGTAA
jgi:hypothetical protein